MSEGCETNNQASSNSKNKDNAGFKTALYIEVPDFEIKALNDGVEDLRLNQTQLSNTTTPRNTSDTFKNCISSDLFKRLEESSPVKITNVMESRKFSDIQLLHCNEADEEEEHSFEHENKPVPTSNGKGKINNEHVHVHNNNPQIVSKNFKLRPHIITAESNTKEEEYRSILGRTPFSPEKRKNSAKDSSPIYNYYDGATEYLSQSFINEYGDNYNFVRKANDESSCSSGVGSSNNLGYMGNGGGMYGHMCNGGGVRYGGNSNFAPINNHINYDNDGLDYEGYGDVDLTGNQNNLFYQQSGNNNMNNNNFNNHNNNNNFNNQNNNHNTSTYSNQCSGNKSNKSNDDSYIVEMFGKRGWICDSCNNFNYESKNFIYPLARVKCNRCGLNKSPKKNTKKAKRSPVPSDDDSTERKKKPFQERVGDWVCIKCKNLNFSFRVICNRCQLPKMESEKMFDQYMGNLMNYVKLNELMQKQIMMNQAGGGSPGIQQGANLIPKQKGLIANNSININNNYYNNFPDKNKFSQGGMNNNNSGAMQNYLMNNPNFSLNQDYFNNNQYDEHH
jgi:hypothetical protein